MKLHAWIVCLVCLLSAQATAQTAPMPPLPIRPAPVCVPFATNLLGSAYVEVITTDPTSLRIKRDGFYRAFVHFLLASLPSQICRLGLFFNFYFDKGDDSRMVVNPAQIQVANAGFNVYEATLTMANVYLKANDHIRICSRFDAATTPVPRVLPGGLTFVTLTPAENKLAAVSVATFDPN